MADPGAINPFNTDPYDDNGPFTEQELLNIISNPNPTLIDLSITIPDNTNIISNPNQNLMNLSINVPNNTVPSESIHRQINNVPPEPVVVNDNISGSNNFLEDNTNNTNHNNDRAPDVIGDPSLPEVPLPDCEFNTVHGSYSDDFLLAEDFGEHKDGFGGNNLDFDAKMKNVVISESSNARFNMNNFEVGESSNASFTISNLAVGENSNARLNRNNVEIGESSNPRRKEKPFVCPCCETLRELIHTNGEDITRLEIHGRVGYICHIIVEVEPNAAITEEYNYQVLHFKDRNLEEVTQFLESYCQERADAGFIMVQDSLASFYKVMSIGTDVDEDILNAIDFSDFNNPQLQTQPQPQPQPQPQLQPQPLALPPPESASASASGLMAAPIAARPEQAEPSRGRTPLALQRQRTGKLTLKDVGKYFHLPIQEAARKMDLCPTVVKKICRRGGLARWPHRKIKSVERRISSWRSVLRTTKNVKDRERAESQIRNLEEQIERICKEALQNCNYEEEDDDDDAA